MSQKLWTAVDQYLEANLIRPEAAFAAALRASAQAGLPPIAVTPGQGKLLHMLARMQGARRILEIGALGGYSTLWLASALPAKGRLVTLEVNPKHAEVALANVARAGLAGRVELRLGKAMATLPRLVAERKGPFDLIFIDADKSGIPRYFTWALKLSRPGTLIVVDNVIRKGAVIDARSADPDVQGVRRLNRLLAKEPRVTATALQTVGSKGYDGMTLILVNAPSV